MSVSLTGRTAIVTGASRGIGLAIARALEREKMKLALISRSKPPRSVAGKFIACDFSDSAAIPGAVSLALEHLGRLDCVVNNAGVFLEKNAEEISLADWERVLRVNLTAPFLICRQTLPELARRRGRIVNVISSSALQGYRGQAAYSASKHGFLGFARCLAIEGRSLGVHIHSLCPGGVETDLIKGTDLGRRLQGQPMIRAQDLAEIVVFLLKQPPNVDVPEMAIRRFG
ncbi:MAG: SDR family oxidoreductase [Verrucomicrobia bacterium]|nr:SDR family oxidoreductase [Verrucomicrobiota bacterium]MDE3099231.1 SDR family oxidoreductase [Verrucomicrobiota bacterium]